MPKILMPRWNFSLIGILIATSFLTSSCTKTPIATDANKLTVETDLLNLANELKLNWNTDSTHVQNQLSTYLGENEFMYGSALAVLDSTGLASSCIYVFRKTRNTLEVINLMNPSYAIDAQAWLREPIDQGLPVWTEPYFDAGGGDVWMQTYSVPIYQGSTCIAVITTDIRVKKP